MPKDKINVMIHQDSRNLEWKNAPILTGSTQYDALPTIHNVLITGAAGFIGSWVARHLTVRYPEYQITCFDKLDYCATLNNTNCLVSAPNFEFCVGDIMNEGDVLRALQKYNIDTILHFAAQTHVDLSFGNSFRFTETNILGTHVMLECSVRVGVRRFIHVSTDEVMGEACVGDPDMLENAVLNPTNPYSASKAGAEMLVNAYAKSFKLPVNIIRSNNVYGPHQFPEKIIPKFCCLLTRNHNLTLHGDGNNTRRYLYASDSANAIDTVLHRGKVGEIYNIDSSAEISNRNVASKLMELFGVPKAEQEARLEFTQDRPFNDRRYAVNGDKLRSLGWQQMTSLEDGLRQTLDWYQKYGQTWWGDISDTLTPFPIVQGREPASSEETEKTLVNTLQKHSRVQKGLKRTARETFTVTDQHLEEDSDANEVLASLPGI